MIAKSRCGYIAIVGRPNVGKSTLLNNLLGSKISITTNKPHTTRWQILGVKTSGLTQAIYIDTPGIKFYRQQPLQRQLNRLASGALLNVDAIVLVIEALLWTPDDTKVLKLIQENIVANHKSSQLILAINKIDKLPHKDKLLPFIATISQKFAFAQIVPLAALTKINLTILEQKLYNYLPEAPHVFAASQVTDKDLKFQVTEIIREQIILHTGQELPYAATVSISDWQETPKILTIAALITVQRPGQQRIIIGQGGCKLKTIGIYARAGIEKLLKCKLMLHLWVKVQD